MGGCDFEADLNMAKVIYIAGVPASGKSAIVESFVSRLQDNDNPEPRRFGKLRGNRFGHVHVLGIYDGSVFGGTDKLSMTVINDAISYCLSLGENDVVIAEGDRLFNARFLCATSAIVIMIDAHDKILKERHRQRGDQQREAFLKRCRSKVENMIKRFKLQRFWNNTAQEQEVILTLIERLVKNHGN